MYTITGADGREYGPVTADQLRQWIAEGRANRQSRVRVEGGHDWRLLGELEEFFPSIKAPPAFAPAPAPFPVPPMRRTNPMAVTGMVLGILAMTFTCCCYGLPFNLAGIICSGTALSQLAKEPLTQQGKGMAVAGLVLSILSLLLAGMVLALGLASSWTDLFRKMRL